MEAWPRLPSLIKFVLDIVDLLDTLFYSGKLFLELIFIVLQTILSLLLGHEMSEKHAMPVAMSMFLAAATTTFC